MNYVIFVIGLTIITWMSGALGFAMSRRLGAKGWWNWSLMTVVGVVFILTQELPFSLAGVAEEWLMPFCVTLGVIIWYVTARFIVEPFLRNYDF